MQDAPLREHEFPTADYEIVFQGFCYLEGVGEGGAVQRTRESLVVGAVTALIFILCCLTIITTLTFSREVDNGNKCKIYQAGLETIPL